MIRLFIVAVMIVAMATVRASALDIVIALAIAMIGVTLFNGADQWVERATGRTSATPTEAYKAVSIGVSSLIGLPPIFLLPGANVFVLLSFQIVGLILGNIFAQCLLGKPVGSFPLNPIH
ncbi:MAG: hypothetical protein V4719_25920 [Planctomycetota bacterium]